MSEFAVSSTYTKNIGKELLIILVYSGMNINYINKSGMTPLMMAIDQKLKSLSKLLFLGRFHNLDINIRSK
jgi:ankyrin repeat protein